MDRPKKNSLRQTSKSPTKKNKTPVNNKQNENRHSLRGSDLKIVGFETKQISFMKKELAKLKQKPKKTFVKKKSFKKTAGINDSEQGSPVIDNLAAKNIKNTKTKLKIVNKKSSFDTIEGRYKSNLVPDLDPNRKKSKKVVFCDDTKITKKREKLFSSENILGYMKTEGDIKNEIRGSPKTPKAQIICKDIDIDNTQLKFKRRRNKMNTMHNLGEKTFNLDSGSGKKMNFSSYSSANFSSIDKDTSSEEVKINFSSAKLKALYAVSRSKITTFDEKIKISMLNKELSTAVNKFKVVERYKADLSRKIRSLEWKVDDIEKDKKEEMDIEIGFPSPMAIMSLFFLIQRKEILITIKQGEDNKTFYELVYLLIDNNNIPKYDEVESQNIYQKFFDEYGVFDIKELFISVIFPKVFKDNENEFEDEIFDYYTIDQMKNICEKIKLVLEKYQSKFFWAEFTLRQILRKMEFYTKINKNRDDYEDLAMYKKYCYLKSLRENLEGLGSGE